MNSQSIVFIEQPGGQVLIGAEEEGTRQGLPCTEHRDAKWSAYAIEASTGIRCTSLESIAEQVDEEEGTRLVVQRARSWEGSPKRGWRWESTPQGRNARERVALAKLAQARRVESPAKAVEVSGTRERIVVVEGILERPDGTVLVERHAEEGQWSYPGGKAIDAEEGTLTTLVRELGKQLQIEITAAQHLVDVHGSTEAGGARDLIVEVQVFRIRGWRGEPSRSKEHEVRWTKVEEAEGAANEALVRRRHEERIDFRRDDLVEALGTTLVALRDVDMGYPLRELPDLGRAIATGLAEGVDRADIDCTLMRAQAPEAFTDGAQEEA